MRSSLIAVTGDTGSFSKIATNPFFAKRVPTFWRYLLKAKGYDLDALAEGVAEIFCMEPGDLYAPGKCRRLIRPGSVFCYWAVRELGRTATSPEKRLGLTQASVSKSVFREEKVVKEMDLTLLNR